MISLKLLSMNTGTQFSNILTSRLQTLFNKIKILGVLTKNIMLWRDTAFLLAIIINILNLVGVHYKDDDGDGVKEVYFEPCNI